MSKIKEIRKIESNIKEIKKEKVESLDDEVEDEGFFEEGHFVQLGNLRRRNRDSTLDSEPIEQKTSNLEEEDRRKNPDEKEINFRASYTGGGNSPYQSKNYTPVGSAESRPELNGLREGNFEDRNGLRRPQDNLGNESSRGGERSYEGDRELGQKKNRRDNF